MGGVEEMLESITKITGLYRLPIGILSAGDGLGLLSENK